MAILEQIVAENRTRPSAILLDLNMPRISGHEVLAYIKETAGLASIPTAILTSSSSPRDRARCLEKGADAYFTKASNLQELDTLARRIHSMIPQGSEPKRSDAPPSDGTTPGFLARIDGLVSAWSLRHREFRFA
jgi:CheY-like chemotaxis protein